MAQAAGLREHGLIRDVLTPVVRFYWDGQQANGGGWCSGTLVRRGIVLTAGHCLYASAAAPDRRGQYGFFFGDQAQLKIAPGNYVNRGQPTYPHGVWNVSRYWVPNRWTQGDWGEDWGLVEIAPDTSGNYPGDYAGTYPAYWDARLEANRSRLYNVGYPTSGGFGTAAWYYGNGQYFCDSIWDGANDTGDPFLGSAIYAIRIRYCPQNGGTSGGPVFTQFSDNSWGIIGVNNLADTAGSQPGPNNFSKYLISIWFDNSFGTFWNSVVGPGSARASSHTGSAVASRRHKVVSPGLAAR